METGDKIAQVKNRINLCIQSLRSLESSHNNIKVSAEQTAEAMNKLDEQLKALGKLGAKPLTPFEQECLDEAADFLNSKLNQNETGK